MPTTVATQVKCPECGARLEVHGDAVTARCAYCGTDSRVQRRTQFFQIPVRLPPAEAHEPQRVAKASRTTGGVVVVLGLVLCGVGIPLALVGKKIVNHVVGAQRGWDGTPIVVDVDGDGTEDFVGVDRRTSPDEMRLIAVSGTDGHTLWETPSLGTYTEIYQGHRLVVGATVLQWDKLAHLDAFDLKTGAKRWRISTPEVVDGACATDDRATVVTADKKRYALALANGALTPSNDTCVAEDPFADVHGATKVERLDIHVDGMNVQNSWDRGSGPRIAFGIRAPGTPVSMTAAIDAAGHALWKAEVAGHDALKLAMISSVHSAISDHEVAVAYERGPSVPPGLTVFDRETGTRRFDIVVDKTFFNVLSGVTLARGVVAVSLWGSLQVFDVQTGAKRFVVGG